MDGVLTKTNKICSREQITSRYGENKKVISSTPPYRKLHFRRHFRGRTDFSLHKVRFWVIFWPFLPKIVKRWTRSNVGRSLNIIKASSS